MEQGSDNFRLDYVFNDMVEDSMISVTYWDKNCREGGVSLTPSGEGYNLELTGPDSSLGTGTGTRGYSLTLSPTYLVAGNSQIWSDDVQDQNGNSYSALDICSRVVLSTANGVEINFLETVLTVRYVFTDVGFAVDGVSITAPEGKFIVDLFCGHWESRTSHIRNYTHTQSYPFLPYANDIINLRANVRAGNATQT